MKSINIITALCLSVLVICISTNQQASAKFIKKCYNPCVDKCQESGGVECFIYCYFKCQSLAPTALDYCAIGCAMDKCSFVPTADAERAGACIDSCEAGVCKAGLAPSPQPNY